MPSLSPLRPPSQGINHPFRLWGHRPHGISKSVKKKNLQQFILLFNLFIKLILPHSKNYHVPWGHIFLTFLVFKNTLSSDGMMAITNLYLGFNAFDGQDSKLVTLWYLFAWFNFFFFFLPFQGYQFSSIKYMLIVLQTSVTTLHLQNFFIVQTETLYLYFALISHSPLPSASGNLCSTFCHDEFVCSRYRL